MGILNRLRAILGRKRERPEDQRAMLAGLAAASGQPIPVVEKATQGYSGGLKALHREVTSGRARIDRTGKVWLKEPRRKSVPATVKSVERKIWGKG